MSHESWIWKVEPLSPSGASNGDTEDDIFHPDDRSSSTSIINDPIDIALYDEPPSRAQVATQLLEELDEYIKEEPFSDWLEEKVEFLFEEIPTPECGQNKPSPTYPSSKQETTQSLLQEFETVLGDVEACHQIYPPTMSHLTPPQTPPHQITDKSMGFDTQLLVALQPAMVDYQINKAHVISPLHHIPQKVDPVTPAIKSNSYLEQISGGWNAENISLMPLSTQMNGDVASELAAMDEYVRSCAADISPSTPSSTYTSSNSYLSSEDSSDPDWSLPITSSGTSGTKKRGQRINSKNRSKPYARPTVEDKKVRKKEQNKNAATRYRQKKKAEIKEIVGEEQELVEYNDKLQDQVKELSREIGYLKGLMRDLFKAKGLMN